MIGPNQARRRKELMANKVAVKRIQTVVACFVCWRDLVDSVMYSRKSSMIARGLQQCTPWLHRDQEMVGRARQTTDDEADHSLRHQDVSSAQRGIWIDGSPPTPCAKGVGRRGRNLPGKGVGFERDHPGQLRLQVPAVTPTLQQGDRKCKSVLGPQRRIREAGACPLVPRVRAAGCMEFLPPVTPTLTRARGQQPDLSTPVQASSLSVM